MRGAVALSLVVLAVSSARADDHEASLTERWREVPTRRQLKLSLQITDTLTELGNFIGGHVNVLSDDSLGLRFDGRKRRARIRLGTGEGHYLRFKLDSDWHFFRGRARVAARLDLGIGEHEFHLELPEVEMLPTSVYGERGVEVRLPLFERRW
jgi:hypothetical protein